MCLFSLQKLQTTQIMNHRHLPPPPSPPPTTTTTTTTNNSKSRMNIERDKAGTASKRERERPTTNNNDSLSAARLAAARLAQEPSLTPLDPRRARAYNLWVKHLAPYQLSYPDPASRPCSADLETEARYQYNKCHTESNGHEQKNEQREVTQVQPLCAARLSKRRLRKQQRWHQWPAHFWRIHAADGTKRGPAAGKGHKSAVRLRGTRAADGTKRGPAAGKESESEVRGLNGVQQQEKEASLKSGCRGPLFGEF